MTIPEDRRCVITGIGVVTPIGTNLAAFWQGVKKAEAASSEWTDRYDLTDIQTKIAAPVRDFEPSQYIDPKSAKRLGRASQFAVVAAGQALSDAKLDLGNIEKERVGVVIGSGIGNIESLTENHSAMLERGPRRVSPYFIPTFMPNAVAADVSLLFGLRGPSHGVVAACATSITPPSLFEAYEVK